MPVFDRRRLLWPLVVPSAGGLIMLALFGAPTWMMAVNGGALLLACAWIWFGRFPTSARTRMTIAASAALLLFAPLITGPDVEGVTRWLPMGPAPLHTGPLLLPVIATLAVQQEERSLWLLSGAGVALAFQPDPGSLFALALACAALAAAKMRSGRTKLGAGLGLVSIAASTLTAVTYSAGILEPRPYVEYVLADAADQSLIQAGGLIAMLASAVWAFLFDIQIGRAEGWALAALLVGFTIIATIGPFPYALIAYGASPILGFGLALGALPHKNQMGAVDLLEVADRNSLNRSEQTE